jgi:cholesterol oxidase
MAYDVIVIGSGFGGAITSCRLAEAGYRVLVLERGRRWDKATYPRRPGDMWLWDGSCPEKENGWLELRVFPHMAVAQGAAVGGGSLIYANISCEAPPRTFDVGWPKEITFADLKPHYDTVADVMDVQPVPDNQWTARMRLMKEAADQTGNGARFKKLELAVSFDPQWTYEQDDPHNLNKSKTGKNKHGATQGTCVHLGNCDIGCDVEARNTLDRNYLYLAEHQHHAEIRPLTLVTNIVPLPTGYRVFFDALGDGTRTPGQEEARIVIVAAGSLGSTELLLRCREETQSLPNISPYLGRGWSSNGDFLTPAFYPDRHPLPSTGPTITCAIDFMDGSQGEVFWIEDGGFPNLLANYLRASESNTTLLGRAYAKMLIEAFGHMLRDDDAEPFANVMPWFAQGVDSANGTLSLHHHLLTAEPCLALSWDVGKSKRVIEAIIAMHERFSAATGGDAVVPPTWSLLKYLVTPHPLGGCGMADTALNGVVNHAGEVFGYRNLFVVDGAIIPEALGVNPSRTIGALAERAAKIIAAEGR